VPATAASEPVILTVRAVVPKHIVGGVYKPSAALFFMPDGSQRQVAEPDPDRDSVRHIADYPPVASDTPDNQGPRPNVALAIALASGIGL
jgi:hypothetical protein